MDGLKIQNGSPATGTAGASSASGAGALVPVEPAAGVHDAVHAPRRRPAAFMAHLMVQYEAPASFHAARHDRANAALAAYRAAHAARTPLRTGSTWNERV